jgi:ergothioneine biosynthesis protein EgtB
LDIVEIGLQHEQQHQELMLTDIKHVLSCNPLLPVYRGVECETAMDVAPLGWKTVDEGIHWIGCDGHSFAFDNERPRHRVFLEDCQIANRTVTCGEYLEFIEDGGYRRPELWLSLGWRAACDENWQAPLYWLKRDGRWTVFTLSGVRDVAPSEPVCHVSYFEADAFARWAGVRLPTEAEWEDASGCGPIAGNFVDKLWDNGSAIHPASSLASRGETMQMLGNIWEWTASPYTPYPGYSPPDGALGEYNGKFMCNQYVLRGGSCATSSSHIRRTYRNFFPPEARWQFSGIRLAR